MLSHFSGKHSTLFFFIFFLLIAAACTKIVTSDIGSDLIPPVDGVTTKDTVLEVITNNAGTDTVKVGLYDDHVLGFVNDPLFGKTTADVNIQLIPPSFPYYFKGTKENRILDSIVLVLSYQGVWGDSLKHLGARVYEISNEEPFTKDSSYSNVKEFNTTSELTYNHVTKDIDITRLNDSIFPYKEAAINQLRIRLDNSLGEKFLNEYDSTLQYRNDTLFRAAFNGFSIKSEEIGNALIRVSLVDTNTKVAIYYRFKDTADNMDTTVQYFKTSPFYSASSNHIVRNMAGAEIEQYFKNTSPQDSLLFLQASPGTYSSISIPGLSSFPNVLIHRAELLMEQVPDNSGINDSLFSPPRLFLAANAEDSSKRFAVPNDVLFTATGVVANLYSFGVFPRVKTDATGKNIYSYNFDLSRYVQSIVTRSEPVYNLQLFAPFNNSLYQFPNSLFPLLISSPGLNYVAIGRIRLRGGGDVTKSSNVMRLHIVYSLL